MSLEFQTNIEVASLQSWHRQEAMIKTTIHVTLSGSGGCEFIRVDERILNSNATLSYVTEAYRVLLCISFSSFHLMPSV